jgi:hypothetical protein
MSAMNHPSWRQVARWLSVVVAATALAALGFKMRGMLGEAVCTLGRMSWLAILALPIFWLWTMAASAGWKVLATEAKLDRIPSLVRLCVIRVEAQAVNLLLPLAGVGGEALRAALLGRQTGQAEASTASVASDVITEIFACFVFAILGILLGWKSIPLGLTSKIALTAIPCLVALALYVLPNYLPRLGRSDSHRRLVRWMASVSRAMPSGGTAGWWRSAAWHVGEKLLIAGETWIYAHALGFPVSIPGAVFATAMMTLASSLMFFIPAQVGAADSGVALGLQWLGASWSVGFAVAFARRLRQLLVAAVGLSLIGLGVAKQRITCRSASETSLVGTSVTVPGMEH